MTKLGIRLFVSFCIDLDMSVIRCWKRSFEILLRAGFSLVINATMVDPVVNVILYSFLKFDLIRDPRANK